MKNLRITLGISAIVIGCFTAFSFAPAKNENNVTLQEFYVNIDGSRGDQVVGATTCKDQTSTLCSQEYDTSTWQATGNEEKMHYYPRQ